MAALTKEQVEQKLQQALSELSDEELEAVSGGDIESILKKAGGDLWGMILKDPYNVGVLERLKDPVYLEKYAHKKK